MRRSLAVAGVVALVLGLAACDTSSGQQPNIVVNTSETQTGISVTGTGEVTGTPDTVEVDIGVSVLGDTVQDAAALAAQKADAIIAAMTSEGVDREDITTTDYSIYPEYDYRNNTETLAGYRVTNTVRAKIRGVDGSGNVIDSAVAAGGDEVRVSGLRFSIEDNAEMLKAARDAAWADALTKAEQLAELSGQTLGSALTINETFSAPPPPIFFEEFAGGGDAAVDTPIEPGTSTVTITLSVVFALED